MQQTHSDRVNICYTGGVGLTIDTALIPKWKLGFSAHQVSWVS